VGTRIFDFWSFFVGSLAVAAATTATAFSVAYEIWLRQRGL